MCVVINEDSSSLQDRHYPDLSAADFARNVLLAMSKSFTSERIFSPYFGSSFACSVYVRIPFVYPFVYVTAQSVTRRWFLPVCCVLSGAESALPQTIAVCKVEQVTKSFNYERIVSPYCVGSFARSIGMRRSD